MKLKTWLNKFAGKPVPVGETGKGATVVGVSNLLMKRARIQRSDLRKLMEDDEIYSAVSTRLAAVHACQWEITGLPDDAEGRLRLQLPVIIDSLFDAILYGFSVSQVVPTDGEIGQVISEEFEAFEFVIENGTPRLYTEINGKKTDVLAAFPTRSNDTFFHLAVYKPSRSRPDGKPLLSLLWWPWQFRQQGWEYWGRFVERFGQPWTWAKTAGDAQKVADQLYSAVQDAVIVSDPATELTLITPKGDGNAHETFIQNIDKRIQKTILGQTLTTDTGKTGSYAAAKVHNLVRRDRLSSDLAFLVPEINKIVARVYGEGVSVVANIPQSGDIDRDTKLHAMGVRFSKEYYSRRYGIDVDEFDIEETATDRQVQASASLHAMASNQRFTRVQQSIEDDLELFIQTNYAARLELLASLLQQAETPEQFFERAALLFANTGDDEQTLADSTFIKGYVAAKKGEV